MISQRACLLISLIGLGVYTGAGADRGTYNGGLPTTGQIGGTVGPIGNGTVADRLRRWRASRRKMGLANGAPKPATVLDVQTPPPKPPRGIPRDYDDLIDMPQDDHELDIDVEDDGEVRCFVDARRPYGAPPKITVTGITDRFNALLVGYGSHNEGKRANRDSLYGWSSAVKPSSEGTAKFTFDVDYVSILPQGGAPMSYCALVFVPPVIPKFDTRGVFSRPAMSRERYIASEDHLVRALKKKSKKVTSCCFIAYPMVSRR